MVDSLKSHQVEFKPDGVRPVCRGIILVKNISLDRNAGPLLLQCVYQATSENLKNMKSNSRFIHLKTNRPALKRRTFIRNVKCFNYSSFVNKNSKENVFLP